jgi:hypothetical protein
MELVAGNGDIRVLGASMGNAVLQVDGVVIRRSTAALLKDALPVVSAILIWAYAQSLEEVFADSPKLIWI